MNRSEGCWNCVPVSARRLRSYLELHWTVKAETIFIWKMWKEQWRVINQY